MLNKAEREAIRTRVVEILIEARHDFPMTRARIDEEYRDRSEHLDYAHYHLRTLTPDSPITSLPPSEERVWKRIYRDDEMETFYDIQPLDITKVAAKFFKVRSPRARITMFVKYLRETAGIKDAVRTAQVLHEYQNYRLFRDPNVVEVYDAGWVRCDDGREHPFVATQFLDGLNLDEWRSRSKPTLKESAETVRVIAATLHRLLTVCKEEAEQEARRTNLPNKMPDFMHLDLKPENLMVLNKKDGTIGEVNATSLKLVDFGSAGFADTANARGTEGYLAPERKSEPTNQQPPNPTWDIFSLGGVLYFLVTGENPDSFAVKSKETWNDWIAKIDLGDSDLNLICRKCLAYDTSARYQLPQQAEEDLSDWLSDRPLRHVRINGYTWWEKQSLLLTRAKKYNNPSDHATIIAQTAMIAGCVIGLNGPVHSLLVLNGFPPEKACQIANTPILVVAFALFIWVAKKVGFRSNSMKILAPVAAFPFACLSILYSIVPKVYGEYPNWNEQVTGGYFALLMASMIWICFGYLSSEWKPLRYWGWFSLALTFFVRPITEPDLTEYAMPVVVSTCEAIACLLFARSLWGTSKSGITAPH